MLKSGMRIGWAGAFIGFVLIGLVLLILFNFGNREISTSKWSRPANLSPASKTTQPTQETTPSPAGLQSRVVEVVIDSQGLTPTEVSLTTSQVVKFINQDSIRHSLAPDNNLWGPIELGPNQSALVAIDSAGQFSYSDRLNPQDKRWRGRLIVY